MIATKKAAALLGVTPRRVRQLIKTGKLPAKKVGRDWVIDLGAIENFKPAKPGRPKDKN